MSTIGTLKVDYLLVEHFLVINLHITIYCFSNLNFKNIKI